MNNQFISLMIFAPLLGAILQAFTRRQGKWIALATSVLASVVAFVLSLSLQGQGPDAAVGVSYPWVGSYAITYSVAIDGLNVLLVLLVALVFPILVASEWEQKFGRRGMQGLLLVLQTAFFGALCAQDLFVQFFFWALSSLPFYFLIAIWGDKDRERAASHTIGASAIGNAFIFAALILVYYSADPHTFLLKDLAGAKLGTKTLEVGGFDFPVAPVAFAMVSLGLALRTPIWPFHGWFTEAATEAPASVFVALAGVSVPVGTYLFVKICYTLFPETVGESVRWIDIIGLLNLLVCSLTAIAQRKLRLLMAFFCLSEVGLILLGVGSLSSAGIVGATYQQMVMGIGLAGFGLFIGILEERKTHDSFLDEQGNRMLGGLISQAPLVSLFTGVLLASLLGFPGMGGFVGRAMLVVGSFSINPIVVVLIGAAMLMGIYYFFNMYKMVFLGTGDEGGFKDLNLRERSYLVPLALALLFCGLYPKPLIEIVRPAALTLLSMVKP